MACRAASARDREPIAYPRAKETITVDKTIERIETDLNGSLQRALPM